MIITKKDAPSSTAIESGAANIKILQDDCITVSREDYTVFLANGIKLDMIVAALQTLRFDHERISMIRCIVDCPEEVGE